MLYVGRDRSPLQLRSHVRYTDWMSPRNIVEEVGARVEYIPRWRLILGVIFQIPPVSVLGMAFLGYELYKAGKRL